MKHPDFIEKVFDQVFHDEILRLKSMEDIWKSRRAPIPLKYVEMKAMSSPKETNELHSPLLPHQHVSSLKDHFELFCSR
jgi:ubiquitin-like 1-activating enzyme E1 B